MRTSRRVVDRHSSGCGKNVGRLCGEIKVLGLVGEQVHWCLLLLQAFDVDPKYATYRWKCRLDQFFAANAVLTYMDQGSRLRAIMFVMTLRTMSGQSVGYQVALDWEETVLRTVCLSTGVGGFGRAGVCTATSGSTRFHEMCCLQELRST